MEEDIEVKVEPFDNDDSEYVVQLQRLHESEQQEALLAAVAATPPPTTTAVNAEDELIIKTEVETDVDDETSSSAKYTDLHAPEMDRMEIVDEQSNIITVNAMDDKSEDERQFMLKAASIAKANPSVRRRKQVFYHETCPQCQQTFNIRRSYELHKEFGLCNLLENKVRCIICPLSFSTKVQLDKHVEMHKLNRFFCTRNCGKFFVTLDDCKMHEYKFHQMRNITCSICNHKFFSCNSLSQHMKSHTGLKRFVCSFCRDWYPCSIDLAKHWQLHKSTCGQLMQDVVDKTMKAIEMTLSGFNDATNAAENEASSVDSTVHPPKKRAKVTSRGTSLDEERTKPSFTATYLSLSDLEIKREPPEISDDQQSMFINSPSSNDEPITNVAIKSEPIDFEYEKPVEIKPEPLSDDEDHLNRQSDQSNAMQEDKMFKPTHQQNANMTATLLKTYNTSQSLPVIVPSTNCTVPPLLPNVKLEHVPLPKTTPTVVKPLQLQNQNIKLPCINLTGYKLFKLMPNAKLLRFPAAATVTATTIKTNATTTCTVPKTTNSTPTTPSGPITLKLKTPLSIKSSSSSMSTNSLSITSNPSAGKPVTVQPPPSAVSDRSSRIGFPAPRVNNCKTKFELKMIECQPQKRAIIDNIKQQIKNCIDPLASSTSICLVEDETTNTNANTNENTNENTNTNMNNSMASTVTDDPTPFIKEEKKDDAFQILDVANNVGGPTIKDEIFSDGNESNGCDGDRDDEGSLIIDETDYFNESSNSSDRTENFSNSIITTTTTTSGVVMASRKTTTESYADSPPIFFINVTTDCDPELQSARKKYREYRYQWKCPRCTRRYSQKYSFRGHLVSVHGFCKEEFSKLVAEVRPYPIIRSLEELNTLLTKQQEEEQKQHKQTLQQQWQQQQELQQEQQQKEKNRKEQQQKEQLQQQELQQQQLQQQQKKLNSAELDAESNESNINDSPHQTDTEISQTQITLKSDNSDGDNNNQNRWRLTCPKCGRRCCTRTALNDHILANCSREPQYPCDRCPKRFYSASTLQQHLSIHTGVLPHKCNFCEKRFRTRGQVTVHHRTHTGERPFECQVCGQRFTHRETLISHLSRHIGMKRYKCYGCNQQFACISGLKTHRDVRYSSCGKVKLNTRAVGPRVRVIKGNVIFEPQPEINPYLRTEDPEEVLAEIHQNAETS